MQKARSWPVAASVSFGWLTLHYTDGTTNQFFLSPSGRFSGMEISNKAGGHAISMNEMLRTFKRVRLLPKEM